jgi:Mn-dependent DtxR family transcriptional regulator
MAKKTSRDRCWNRTLSLILNQGTVFKADLIKAEGVSERTAGDVLNTMKQMGWIEREPVAGPKPDKWKRGDKLPATISTEQA